MSGATSDNFKDFLLNLIPFIPRESPSKGELIATFQAEPLLYSDRIIKMSLEVDELDQRKVLKEYTRFENFIPEVLLNDITGKMIENCYDSLSSSTMSRSSSE